MARGSHRYPGIRSDSDLYTFGYRFKPWIGAPIATAATVVPALAADCEDVTVLQRSPTYFIPGMNQNCLADRLRKLEIKEEWIHEIVRRQILSDQREFTRRALEEPAIVTQELLAGVRVFAGRNCHRALHAHLSTVAPAHCLRAGRRHFQGRDLGQGQRGDRRD